MDWRCFKILSELMLEVEGLTYNELWRRVKLPKKTFHSHLGHLREEGLVESEELGRRRMVRYKVKKREEIVDWFIHTVDLAKILKTIHGVTDGRTLMYVVFFFSQLLVIVWVLSSVRKERFAAYNTFLALHSLQTIVGESIRLLQSKRKLRGEALQSTSEHFEKLLKQCSEGTDVDISAEMNKLNEWINQSI